MPEDDGDEILVLEWFAYLIRYIVLIIIPNKNTLNTT